MITETQIINIKDSKNVSFFTKKNQYAISEELSFTEHQYDINGHIINKPKYILKLKLSGEISINDSFFHENVFYLQLMETFIAPINQVDKTYIAKSSHKTDFNAVEVFENDVKLDKKTYTIKENKNIDDDKFKYTINFKCDNNDLNNSESNMRFAYNPIMKMRVISSNITQKDFKTTGEIEIIFQEL